VVGLQVAARLDTLLDGKMGKNCDAKFMVDASGISIEMESDSVRGSEIVKDSGLDTSLVAKEG
jgi:hypothetical protein